MRWFVIPITLMLLASSVGAAPPASEMDSKTQARRRFKLGMAAFTLERFDDAIREFEAGFLVEPDPVFLYNIAQAYRLSKRPDQAITHYRKYLAMAPDAPNRVEVEQRIEAMKKLMEEKDRPPHTVVEPGGSQKPPPTTPPPASLQQPPTSPAVHATTTGATVALVTAPPAAPAPRKKWPIVVGVVVGGVVVGAGVGLGVGLGTSSRMPESSGFVDISK